MTAPQDDLAGKHVAIVAQGPSSDDFTAMCKMKGGASAFCDEVWGINAMGDTVRCHRVFHMDDVRIQEKRAEQDRGSAIAGMVAWLRTHPGPVYTSHPALGYPGLVAYPLSDVVRTLGQPYFNGTVAYAMAYAIYRKVGTVSIYGCDYTYANSHHAERGRGCLEYWIGQASARGMRIHLPPSTTLMDVVDGPDARFYGYDGYKVEADNNRGVTLIPRELPTAEAVEQRYDHDKPTNTYARGGAARSS